jgi:hypothetical protein
MLSCDVVAHSNMVGFIISYKQFDVKAFMGQWLTRRTCIITNCNAK